MTDLEIIKLPSGTLQINTNKCGMKFEGIAFILEPYSPVPLIHIPKPLGILATVEILIELIKELKKLYPIESTELNCIDTAKGYLESLLFNLEIYTEAVLQKEIDKN